MKKSIRCKLFLYQRFSHNYMYVQVASICTYSMHYNSLLDTFFFFCWEELLGDFLWEIGYMFKQLPNINIKTFHYNSKIWNDLCFFLTADCSIYSFKPKVVIFGYVVHKCLIWISIIFDFHSFKTKISVPVRI